jgi:hypothetical protein
VIEDSDIKRSSLMRTAANFRWLLCFALIFVMESTGQKTDAGSLAIRHNIDLNAVLSWFPVDTETLEVANGPFWMSNFVVGEQDDKDHDITSVELEKQFEGLTLALFDSGKGLLEKHLERKKVLLALEGSRHFRTPAGLGELPFEGCAVAIFQDDLGDRRDAFMKDAAGVAVRTEEIEGQKVAEFEEQMEQDKWTLFVTFPEKRVVLVSTNKEFLQEMLARMHDMQGPRALPDNLREWAYVNKTAQFWGMRHYDRQQAKYDPTSPFGGEKSANFPDEEAVGLTYQCDPRTERRATLTYIAGPRVETRKIAEDRFPDTGDAERMAGLHVQHRELAPGVIQSTFDLSHSQPASLFFFIFMDHLGHAVYL